MKPMSPQELTLYERKLQDPKWKRIAALVKSRDNHQCQECGTFAYQGVTLAVHHTKYTMREPWMEPQQNLITLCRDCHDMAHNKPMDGENEAAFLARHLVKRANYQAKKVVTEAKPALSLDKQIEWARSVYYTR